MGLHSLKTKFFLLFFLSYSKNRYYFQFNGLLAQQTVHHLNYQYLTKSSRNIMKILVYVFIEDCLTLILISII
jgi:hypothetical protein